MNHKIREIVDNFKISGELINIMENSQGNINSTYLLSFKVGEGTKKYLLQKINSYVFKEPHLVVKNIELVTEHINSKLQDHEKTLRFIRTNDNELIYTYVNEYGEKEYYRVYEYIENCTSFDNLKECDNSEYVAYSAGKCYGTFHKYLNDFPVSFLADIIPNFHNTPKRIKDLVSSIENGVIDRAIESSEEIIYLLSRRKTYSIIWENLGKNIPIRVTHNDTKLNNILMDKDSGSGVAVIDLDTVMPGSILFDIGDGIRSACSNSFEDELDKDKIFLNMDYTKAYIRGYLEEMLPYLTQTEIRYIGLSIATLTYELALRFLTDYINNDVYFKVKYKTHNYDRFINQFTLLKDIENKIDEINKFVRETCKELKKQSAN